MPLSDPSQQSAAPSPKSWLRFAPLALIVIGLAGAYAAGLHKHLSLDTLRDQQAGLEAFVAANLPLAIAIYMGLYILAVALSLPGALFLTLSGGFLFGAWLGGGITVVAATIGATAIFLAARTALGDTLRAKAGGFIKKLEAGFRENAFNYLLTLRLFPGAPFFVVNLAPAFLGVKLRDYVLATFLGIIPGTLVYASVGAGLKAAFAAGVDVDPVAAAREILFQPVIIGPIIGLIALSLAPVAFKALKRRRARA